MNTSILYIIMLLAGILVTYIVIPFFKNMLISSDVIRPNYKKDMIPVSMGLVFLPTIVINGIILAYFTKSYENIAYIFMYMFGLMAMCLAGILKGNLTTGGFKALFGGFVGLIISVAISKNLTDIVINTLIIALSTNLMNLLDLRPGRAIKVYLVISITLFLTLVGYPKALLLILLPSVCVYFIDDLKARAMMGDTGSNVLGISIGILISMGYDMPIRISWLVFLIFIHILTEKYSLTKIIENNKVLNFIDKLGR